MTMMRMGPRCGVQILALMVTAFASDAAAQPQPTSREAAIASARERDLADTLSSRRELRVLLELGASVFSSSASDTRDALLRRRPGIGAMMAVGARTGLGGWLEAHLRLELTGPLSIETYPHSVSDAVAATRCEGSRVFDLPTAPAMTFYLEPGIRLRVLSMRSPFYVGVGIRLGIQAGSAEGPVSVRCVGADGATRDTTQGMAARAPLVSELGGQIETGFRFGDRESWDIGLRLIAQGVGTEDPGIRGMQFFLGWHPR